MRCPRCGGMMHYEEFVNTMDEGMAWSFDGWRCVYCGEVVDPLILYNRSLHHQKTETRIEEKTAVWSKRGRR